MRRFRFRLERFLQLRRYDERKWEMKLAEATGRCLKLGHDIEERERSIAQTILDRTQGVGPLDLSTYKTGEMYMQRLSLEITALEQELEAEEARREEIQNGYLEASRRRKVLDRLKEKREESYRREQRLEEFKGLDDINTSRTGRLSTRPELP